MFGGDMVQDLPLARQNCSWSE